MDTFPAPFVPPAPMPRATPPSTLEMIRIVYRNPLELWGEPSYNEPWISVNGIGGPLVIANDPALIRHVLVDNAKNYKMATVRQKILRPILRDGLLTAEGEVWKRSRKAMAPVFTPRHIFGFAKPMLERTNAFAERYEAGGTVDVAADMTLLTYDILAETLFTGEISGEPGSFAREIEHLFETMGRVDPLDLLRAPDWLPRFTRLRGRKTMAYFRKIVADTIAMRSDRLKREPDKVPEDFLTLLLRAEGPSGLTRGEIEDNIITFIGAGHETTARALGWTIYCLAEASWERAPIEKEIDAVLAREPDPVKWLDAMPLTRAAFEEALRLYPPAPSINREPIEPEQWRDLYIPRKGRGADDAVDHPSPPQAVGPAGRLHAVALPSRKPRQDRPLPVSALRRRSARLHRRQLRHAGGDHRARRADVEIPLRHDARNEAVAGAEAHHPAAGRPADAGHAAQLGRRRFGRRVPRIGLHLALELHGHGLAEAVLGLAGRHADPALADAILADVLALFSVEDDADAALQRLGIEVGAVRLDAQPVGKGHCRLQISEARR